MKISPSMFIGVNGDDHISFGAGQPDLPPPEDIYKILGKYRHFKYGLVQGQDNLREQLSKEFKNSTKDDFVITNGASEAIDLTLRHLGREGGSILLHKPYYYSYVPLAQFNNLKPIFTETVKGRIDMDDFDKKVRDCKAVMINSPSNPTGRLQKIKTLKEIEKLCQDLKVTIISDEVYKDLIYERENYMLQGDQVVTINSFSKTFSMCGFRVGYLYSNHRDIIEGATELKTHTSMNTSIVSQEMAYEATKVDRSFVDRQVKIWKERRDLIYKGLQDLGLDVWKPEGAFYVLPKVKDADRTVSDLYFKYKVITYLGEWFGAPGRIRLSYALDSEKIEKGLKIIGNYLKDQ